MKITFPNWVYNCLNRYGNCALPYNSYTKDQITEHLSYKLGKRVCLRLCKFRTNYNSNDIQYKNYYVAEVK